MWVSLVLGCGGVDPLPVELDPALDGAGIDGTVDDASNVDDGPRLDASETAGGDRPADALGMEAAASGDAGLRCGTSTCGAGESCCVSADTASKYQCVAGECPGRAPLHATAPRPAPQERAAPTSPSPRRAAPRCARPNVGRTASPSVQRRAPGTAKLRRCHSSKDCTQPVYSNCCSFESGGVVSDLCANDALVPHAKSCK